MEERRGEKRSKGGEEEMRGRDEERRRGGDEDRKRGGEEERRRGEERGRGDIRSVWERWRG